MQLILFICFNISVLFLYRFFFPLVSNCSLVFIFISFFFYLVQCKYTLFPFYFFLSRRNGCFIQVFIWNAIIMIMFYPILMISKSIYMYIRLNSFLLVKGFSLYMEFDYDFVLTFHTWKKRVNIKRKKNEIFFFFWIWTKKKGKNLDWNNQYWFCALCFYVKAYCHT